MEQSTFHGWKGFGHFKHLLLKNG
uniref:Uncharacterized protein n=1 Tax=Tetranychus urticae TaxID=32264 RepID=T1L3W5_TETUR